MLFNRFKGKQLTLKISVILIPKGVNLYRFKPNFMQGYIAYDSSCIWIILQVMRVLEIRSLSTIVNAIIIIYNIVEKSGTLKW